MAYCTQCGNYVEDGNRFCTTCGAALDAPEEATPAAAPEELSCPACGAAVPAGNSFCTACGANLAEAAAAPVKPTCPACGAEVPYGNSFCTVCGANLAQAAPAQAAAPQEAKSGSKKGVVIALAGIVLGLLLAIGVLAVAKIGPFAQGGGSGKTVSVDQSDSYGSSSPDVESGNIEVPDLSGLTADQAQSQLKDAGLDPARGEDQHSQDVEEGKVISQAPEAGVMVAEGQSVQYVVSLGAYPQPGFPTATASSELPGDATTSYYGPNNAIDGNSVTAWNEGSAGNGTGEWIQLSSDSPQYVSGVKIMAGYPKTSASGSDVYYQNARPKDIVVELSDGTSINYTLEDKRDEFQQVDFGGIKETTSIKITIQSVYPGNIYQDCCIAEIVPTL